MPSFVNTFGGTVVYPADVSYRAVALTANVTLTWPTELATNTNVVASIMDVTPSGAGLTIRMPDATQASVGQTALFFNVGASSFTVADNSGNTIQTIASGESWQIYLTGNATVNGTWRPIQYGVGTSSASASALAGAGLKAITTTLNQSAPTTLLSADYTLTSVDRARVIVWNGGAGTFTMPSAATAGNDWFFDARNSGTGGLTIQPAGGELINGQANLVFNPGDSARIITDGIGFYTIGYGQSSTFAFDYVSISLTGQPSPYTLSGANLNRIAYQFSGILTANMEIIVPNTIQQYWIRNTTTGSYTLTVKTSGGTGVAVVQNGAAIMYCDGTNVVEADTNNLSSPVAVSQGGTGATSAGTALVNLGGTSLGIGVFTAINPSVARAALGAAASGANADITSLTGLTTALSVAQGGTGQTSYTNGQLLIGNTTGNTLTKSTLTAGTGVTITNGTGTITIAGTGPDTFPATGIAYSTGTAWGASYTTSGTGTTLALSASPALTGTPTAPTATAGTNTTQIATTAYVVGTAFSSALPGQTGNADKFVTTDGTSASWSFVPLATGVTGTLPVANGGTGATTLTGVVKGNGTGAFTAGTVALASEVSGTLPVANGGTGATTLTANNVLLGNGTSALQTVAPGTSGNALVSNGTSWISQAVSSASVQTFSSSGTWTKPSGASFVLVEIWGAGGGGGRPTAGAANAAGSGGGGGAYAYKLFNTSSLGDSVPVTIGAGGPGGASNGADGSTGGSTNFGNRFYAYGGGGGTGSATIGYQKGGGGGGAYSVGVAGISGGAGGNPLISDAIAGSIITTQVSGGGGGGGQYINGVTTLNQLDGSASTFGGGGGSGAITSSIATNGGGASIFGGSGGGAGGRSITGGSSSNQDGTSGGSPTFAKAAGAFAFFGASGGGQPPIYGLTSPPAAANFEGGGGGVPTVNAINATPNQSATNGAQVVLLSTTGTVSGNTYSVLLVSSDGLANYTPYVVPIVGGQFSGIVFDGSKYVIAVLQSITNLSSFYRSIISTTDFVNFTNYEFFGIPATSTTISNISTDSIFNYINGIYFLCTNADLYYSTDLTSWTAAGLSTNIYGITYDGTYYYALTTTTIRRSTDLINWTSYNIGVTGNRSIAASPTVIVVTSTSALSRYSTDQGVTWSNSPTITAGIGRRVEYFAATGDWLMLVSGNQLYYTTSPTTSWTLSTAASVQGPIAYNGTRYILGSIASTSIAAYTSTTAAGTFASQALTALPTAATPGSPGGIAGGGGGGAGSSTATTNGGAGGNGFCRVYTW